MVEISSEQKCKSGNVNYGLSIPLDVLEVLRAEKKRSGVPINRQLIDSYLARKGKSLLVV